MGNIFNSRNGSVAQHIAIDSITLGTVISSSDPHQMGRLKILCPAFGDDPNSMNPDELPWASKVSPLGGMTNSSMKRGPNEGKSSVGPIAYGIWGVPKVGSTVLVCCIDGDPYYRLWLGSIFDQGSTNTLPHGRYFYAGQNGEPDGPLDSQEKPIEPLYTNQTKAFTSRSKNYEWRTRGADFSATGNSEEFSDLAPSTHADEVIKTSFNSADGQSFDIKNGYAAGRMDGQEKNEESSVYSWTSPGFHSISMDDRPENCRVRVRTTSGAQILMDDTNERIYVSTPQGENWIEMDYNGNIDMFGRRIALHATKDINLTADDTVRIMGKKGVHVYSGDEMSLQAVKDLSVSTDQNIRVKSGQVCNIESIGAMNAKSGATLNTQSTGITGIKSGATINIDATSDLNVKAGTAASVTAGANLNLKAGGQILNTGSQIHLNGPSAASADSATSAGPAEPHKAKWTNRIPMHEPFTRTVTKDDYSHVQELQYDDPNVGKKERDDMIERGKFWRR